MDFTRNGLLKAALLAFFFCLNVSREDCAAEDGTGAPTPTLAPEESNEESNALPQRKRCDCAKACYSPGCDACSSICCDRNFCKSYSGGPTSTCVLDALYDLGYATLYIAEFHECPGSGESCDAGVPVYVIGTYTESQQCEMDACITGSARAAKGAATNSDGIERLAHHFGNEPNDDDDDGDGDVDGDPDDNKPDELLFQGLEPIDPTTTVGRGRLNVFFSSRNSVTVIRKQWIHYRFRDHDDMKDYRVQLFTIAVDPAEGVVPRPDMACRLLHVAFEVERFPHRVNPTPTHLNTSQHVRRCRGEYAFSLKYPGGYKVLLLADKNIN